MKLHATCGERAVHISATYDDAETCMRVLAASKNSEVKAAAERVLGQIKQARGMGRPKANQSEPQWTRRRN